jgi:hypothetical protein
MNRREEVFSEENIRNPYLLSIIVDIMDQQHCQLPCDGCGGSSRNRNKSAESTNSKPQARASPDERAREKEEVYALSPASASMNTVSFVGWTRLGYRCDADAALFCDDQSKVKKLFDILRRHQHVHRHRLHLCFLIKGIQCVS